ncbi:bZIP transcription factor 44 [Brachypodium distachyon]|uniref:BZIP domain-containing protein n=1 Tax=Brachypodium distachyon TaxID=15368 RepID=I1I384_BRADI|nr:bZIP transcription factor 44 [Brachypodium distachyon]KQJ96266.1 hypothetical protein BRADI_3g22040v3 [Brachypodium distachyon]|eukprot:XP_003571697.1 bZIP transcription factor 44 [Brachypodium distachyon]
MSLSGGTLSSETLSGSSHGTQSYGSEGNLELQARMDLKRKRRKESNRESAKRSRLRKQQQLEELTTQVNQLRTEKQQLVTTLNLTVQSYAAAETQNSVLRSQAMELESRLRALREIIYYMNSASTQFRIPTAASQTTAAAYYPTTSLMASAAASYDVAGANAWGSGMQMLQQQQPIELMYHRC